MLLSMPEEAADLIGGRYQLAEPVIQAGLGRIWRGHDRLLDREVAVMEISLPRPGGDRADTVDAIMRQVQVAARHGSADGITVHDVAEQAGALWVVTQPGEGESLDATIAASGQLPPVTAPSVTAPSVASPAVSARPSQAAPPPAPGPAGRGTGRLATAMRANAGLTVGLATGLVMILALVLVVLLFPSHHRPASPPGGTTVSSTP
jgi:hypothetical protein